MVHMALRVPTVSHDGTVLPGGHAYVIFKHTTITVYELLVEKVRAEVRKAQAGGKGASSIELLCPITGWKYDMIGGLDCEREVLRRYAAHELEVEVDGVRQERESDIIELTTRTALCVVVPERIDHASNTPASDGPDSAMGDARRR